MKKLILIFFCSGALCPPLPDWENALYMIFKHIFNSKNSNKHQNRGTTINLQPSKLKILTVYVLNESKQS